MDEFGLHCDRTAGALAARQGPWRIEQHQRGDLVARPALRIRSKAKRERPAGTTRMSFPISRAVRLWKVVTQ
jgi:hypothetical protein